MKYGKAKANVSWGEYDTVYLSPADGGFSPCGWFHVKFLLKD